MDWTIKPKDQANHPPVVKLGHPNRLSAKPRELVNISAEGTTDPDGDKLSYKWFFYNEAGTFTMATARTGQALEITNADQVKASFTVPHKRVMAPGTGDMHIILEVTDNGSPKLTRYQRVIVTVKNSL
jgi:hypothetical protein